MLSLLGILIFLVIVLLIGYFYITYTYWKRRGVVHEKPVLLFGNFKGFGSTIHVRDITQRLYDQFKNKASFCGAYIFFSKSVLILDLDLIKQILIKDFNNFHDLGLFSNVKDDPLSGHLVALEGEDWRAMRTKLTPVFTSAKMRYMFSTVDKVGEIFAETMRETLKKTNDHIVEIKDLCARFNTDVIGTCAFGIECNSLNDPDAEFRVKGKSIFTETRHNILVQMFMLTNRGLARKLRLKLYPDSVSDFFLNIVKQTVAHRLENNIKRNDFMDLLIELKAKQENLPKDHIDLSQGLTIEQMAAQTFVFFLAGFETSSTTMSFCLYELAKNVEIQDKLRKEILDVVKNCDGKLTYDVMNSMAYLEQVLAETLRLYPVLPSLIRLTKNDYLVPNTTHIIEKGISITIPVAAIHSDPQYYENPHEFKPSRFEAAEIEKRHPMAYLPFGDGPRSCIGSRFGKMQTKMGLISMLRYFRFECCPLTESPIELDTTNTLVTPKNGIHLKVIPL